MHEMGKFEESKKKLLELAKERKLHARAYHLVINREMSAGNSIRQIIDETEKVIEESGQETTAEPGKANDLWAHKVNESMDHSFLLDNYAISPTVPGQAGQSEEKSQLSAQEENEEVSIDSHEAHIEWMQEMTEQHYPTAVKEEIKPSIYKLDKGWRERRGQALKIGLEKLADAVERGEIKFAQSDQDDFAASQQNKKLSCSETWSCATATAYSGPSIPKTRSEASALSQKPKHHGGRIEILTHSLEISSAMKAIAFAS